MGQEFEEILKDNILKIKPIGYSMYPVIVPERDYVYIEKADFSELKRGDVILYRRTQPQAIYVLHRIWKVKSDGVYTVGDNQKDIEGPLGSDVILGKMIALDRNGKHIEASGLMYRLLTGIWLVLRPVRRPFSVLAHKVKVLCMKSGIIHSPKS